jgi:lipopolysaccharide/colanic/teichoic acid biosynthesis glycosyltransferase
MLGYLVLTVLVFEVVQRYALRVTRLYGYDIKNVGVQFGLYFAIFAGFTLAAVVAAARFPVVLSRENQLRLSFAAVAALSLAAAVYQSRFGAMMLVNYFTVGTLGSFAAALAVTLRQYRLVEVVGRPPRAIVDDVLAAHRAVVPAATAWDRVKRAAELVVSIMAILASLPISVPLAMAIWLQDPGPLLVAKVAVKRAGQSFHQLKLRTMVKNAEAVTGPVPAEPGDSRVTWLGGLLRRTHIDELPQMVNIAFGDMSFVGPRPERTVFVHRHLRTVPNYALRHQVRPGLAGLAQVYGDYYSTPAQKLRFDLLYIRRRGPALDLRVFSAAVLMALFGVRPGRGRRRSQGDVRARWRSAYTALRGEPAPDGLDQRRQAAAQSENHSRL